MKLYIAGLAASSFSMCGNLYRKCNPQTKALRRQVSNHLESYHFIHKGRYVERIRKDGVKVFLDSGAFSSYSLGIEVSIEAYAEFIKEHQDIIIQASVLDAIGDPEGTYRNQNTLEKLGVEVLPCFHFGEPLSLCEYYVSNYDYITIGGMVPIPNNRLEPWLDEIWDKVLTDKDGYSRVKVHGFGLTSRKLMNKYPWYSCDSSSWVQAASNGSIVLPEFDKAISISARSPQRKVFGQHFDTFPAIAQKKIADALGKYELTVEMVRDDYKPRWGLNCFSFDRIGKLMGDDHHLKPFKTTQPLLF